jgi:anti-sigma regulatory factor (Ser/Thr protein kinase)
MTAPHTHPLRLCVRRTPVPGEVRALERVVMRVPSEVDCIEEAVAVLTRHCLAGAAASPKVQFRLQVALSDALANAIVRGNREDAGKQVYVQVDLLPDAVNIHVTDEGDGFDHASVAEALDPQSPDLPSGRGLFLIRHMVDDVHFNTQGNSICMTLRRQ